MFRIFRHLPPFGGINASRSFVFKNIQTSFSKNRARMSFSIPIFQFPILSPLECALPQGAPVTPLDPLLRKAPGEWPWPSETVGPLAEDFKEERAKTSTERKGAQLSCAFAQEATPKRETKKRRRWTGYDSLSTVTFAEAVMSRKTLMVTLYSPSTLMGSASCTWRLSTLKPCAARPSAMSAVVTEPKS